MTENLPTLDVSTLQFVIVAGVDTPTSRMCLELHRDDSERKD